MPAMLDCPHCGAEFPLKKTGKPRSNPQHRRLFGLIKAAFEHWPEQAEFQPDDAEHLRAFLICSAGAQWREKAHITVPYAADQPQLTKLAALSIEAAIRAAGSYAFIRPHPDGGSVAVFRAKSISWARMSHLEFCALSNAIDDVIRAEAGLDPDKLLAETEQAAA